MPYSEDQTFRSNAEIWFKTMFLNCFYFKTMVRILDQGSGQGAKRLKSGAYTRVCEHFSSFRNTALGT